MSVSNSDAVIEWLTTLGLETRRSRFQAGPMFLDTEFIPNIFSSHPICCTEPVKRKVNNITEASSAWDFTAATSRDFSLRISGMSGAPTFRKEYNVLQASLGATLFFCDVVCLLFLLLPGCLAVPDDLLKWRDSSQPTITPT